MKLIAASLVDKQSMMLEPVVKKNIEKQMSFWFDSTHSWVLGR